MNDDLMFDYLMQMGAMRPEQEELRRRQAMVEALRDNSMTPQKGQMISGHYVGPGIAGAISQLGQAYMAKQGQAGVDSKMAEFNAKQAQALEEMRRRRRMGMGGQGMESPMMDPYSNLPTYGNKA